MGKGGTSGIGTIGRKLSRERMCMTVFLQQGTVDELSLLVALVADGSSDSVTVFEKSDYLPTSVPVEFQLKNIERLKGDGIRLVYTVNNKE